MSAPRVVDVRGPEPDPGALSLAVDHVRSGGLLAYPTETVYGFGGPCTGESVEAVLRLKRREAAKPLLVLVAGVGDVAGLAWTDAARELAEVFWPGAVTLVLADPRGIFPAGVRSTVGAVAVRVSPHPLVAPLLAMLGGPLTSTSANAPGVEPARAGDEALRAAQALGAGAEMLILDGGVLPPSGPSTIVDCTGTVPTVVREGTVPVHRLRCAIPEIHGR